ncbi:MAG: hypothetical protein ACRD2G_09925 [Terriglobia bacterium]
MIRETPWVFYVYWIPKFLSTTQRLDLHAIGLVAWVPFLFADLGSLGGGWLSGLLIRRGRTPVKSRLAVMLICACVTTFTFVIHFAHSTVFIIALMSLMMLCVTAWMVNLSTLPVDVFPQEIVGTAVGLTTAGAVVGQLALTFAIGHIVQVCTYAPAFFIMSCPVPIAYCLIRLILRGVGDPGLKNSACVVGTWMTVHFETFIVRDLSQLPLVHDLFDLSFVAELIQKLPPRLRQQNLVPEHFR